MALSFLRHSASIFPKFSRKDQEWTSSVGRGALALGRAGVVVLLLGLGFLDLESDLRRIRFVALTCFPEDPGSAVLW